MINGLGGARGINRRFIADCTSSKHRHEASAAFVAAGAVGMAFGPATAAALKLLPTFTLYDGFVINELTAPGYIMSLLWLLHFLLVLFCFRDPQRVLLPTERPTDAKVAAARAERSGDMMPLLRRKKSVSYGSLSSAGTVGSSPSTRPSLPSSSGVDRKQLQKIRDGFQEDYSRSKEKVGFAPETDASQKTDQAGPDYFTETSPDEAEVMPEQRRGVFRRLLSCLGQMDPGVLLMLWLFFVNKFTVEVLMSSAPSVSRSRFEFTTSQCSLMMAVFGILVLPTNAALR